MTRNTAQDLKLDPELGDLIHPYTASIEPINRPVFRHGFHLGTDLRVAKWFAKELWHRHNANWGVYTVAIMQNGRVIDTYDGRDWSRENPWYHDHPGLCAMHEDKS